jgi:hypothetical protein
MYAGGGPITPKEARDQIKDDRASLQDVSEEWNTQVGNISKSTGIPVTNLGIFTDGGGDITNRSALLTQANTLRESQDVHVQRMGQTLAELLEADRLLDLGELSLNNDDNRDEFRSFDWTSDHIENAEDGLYNIQRDITNRG